MTTNKEKIENLESSLGAFQNRFQEFEIGITDKLRGIEIAILRLTDATNRDDGGGATRERRRESGQSSSHSLRSDRENQLGHGRSIKLDFPRFQGGDPTAWISKVKQYFDYQAIPPDQQVSFASYHLEDEANEWWQATAKFLREDHIEITWWIFEEELWNRFGPTDGEDFDEALAKIKQTGTLREYQRDFERLQNKVESWSQKALIGTFMGGLKEGIADGVRMFRPKTLKEAIGLARLKDEQFQRSRRTQSYSNAYQRPARDVVTNTNAGAVKEGIRATPPRDQPDNMPKKLSWEEIRKKRSLGLCFSCDERYTPGHRCRKPQLLLMEGEDEEDNLDSELHEENGEPEITLHALVGWDSTSTIRIHTMVAQQRLVALIDSGSSHNFISQEAANRLDIVATPTRAFQVKVADGHPLHCTETYKNVPLMIGNATFSITLFALPLTGLDVVLGMQWLTTLGVTTCDWKLRTLAFKWEGKEHVIRGMSHTGIHAAPAKALKADRQGQQLFTLKIHMDQESDHTVTEEMQTLLNEFQSIFLTPTELPPMRDIVHHITLKEGTDPINVRPYRYAYFQKDEIEKQVDNMLQSGLIQPSSSPFSSPVLLVKKKDGSWRFCTDYRALNAATVKDRFPIPTVEDMLDELHGSKFFSKLDLTAGYHQVRVHTPDIPKTAFRTHNGHYEYLVMPFGLCNAPSTFQALMNSVFHAHLRKFVIVFFDDILVYSRTWLEHLHHVRVVLQLLQDNQLFLKRKKCEFGKTAVEYLGHIITHEGVQADQKKISVMLDWPAPTTITELRGFLGLTGYYRKFVKDYGLLARPLTNLLKKGRFAWTDQANNAFNSLKAAMTSTPTLALPDFSKDFVIQTDASGEGIGAVLTQEGRPIAYMSRALGIQKQSWSTYAREMLAIVIAIRMWRPYLLGRRFTIQTDQQSLRFLLEQRILTAEQQKWMGKLVGYDYAIVYKPGASNRAADALSRKPGSPELQALSIPHISIWEDLRRLATTDPYLLRIGALADRDPGHPYSRRNGLLCFHNRIVIPPNSMFIPTLLQEYHNSQVGGHSGTLRTFKRIAQQFYWPSMQQSIKAYISACDVCQKAKSDTLAPAGLLQPLPIPNHVWEDVSMDFVDGLPRSAGHTSIMVVVDRLTKAAHLVALSHPYTARTIASAFIIHIVKLHGPPRSILSDRDPIFISSFWREFWKLAGTKLRMSSAYHPQTDGQTEVVNRCVEQYLRCFVSNRPKSWSAFLPWAEYWYNTTHHASTGMTPFQALYGRPPPALPMYEPNSSLIDELDEQLQARDEVLLELKNHLVQANNRMKQEADKHRRDLHFNVGDWVYLRLQPYRQRSVFNRSSQKLSNRYYGPFQVSDRIGTVAYRLILPATARIHPVFHVSKLKPWRGTTTPSMGTLPPLRSNGELCLTPAAILDHRFTDQPHPRTHESLVQWSGLSSTDATWEATDQLARSFPSLNLEDKVVLDGEGIDSIDYEEHTEDGVEDGVSQSEQENSPNHADVHVRRSTRQRKRNPKFMD